MIDDDLLPQFITVGPLRERRFDEAGRLMIDLDGGTHGSWMGTRVEGVVGRAALIALLLDVLDPRVDSTVGAAHRLILNSRIDDRGDLRGGQSPMMRTGYGALAPFALDLDVLSTRATLTHSLPGRAHPAYDGELFHHPRNTRIAQQLGPGASWFRNGRQDYFEQILSYESDLAATQPTRATERALQRWAKAEQRWEKRRTDAQRALEGPWC